MLVPMTAEQQQKAQATKAAKRAEWEKLDLRQEWADEAWMVECARAHGIKILPRRLEPATPRRLRKYARQMGATDFHAVVGKSAAEWIAMNPTHPLWVMVCHLAEMMG